jgi:hypothetical protein
MIYLINFYVHCIELQAGVRNVPKPALDVYKKSDNRYR